MKHSRSKYSMPSLSLDPPPARTKVGASITPNSSHFRLVCIGAVGNKPIDAVHRKVFLPQWKFSEQYEQLLRTLCVPFHTEDIAYSLPHLLSKISSKSGIPYTRVYTETGRLLRTLADLPDFHTKIVLATADDPPPERQPQKPEVTQQRIAFSSPSLPRLKVHRSKVISRTSSLTSQLTFCLPVRRLSPTPQDHTRKVTRHLTIKSSLSRDEPMEEITLLGATIPARARCQGTMTQDQTCDSPDPETPKTLASLFSHQQIDQLQREYVRLRHSSLVEKVNEAVKFSPRLPGNVKNFLTGVKSKVLVKCKDGEVFAMYLRDTVPVLRGKPQNVLRAILQGLGSNGNHLSWSQWLLLNSLLIHDTALESTKVNFICRVTCT